MRLRAASLSLFLLLLAGCGESEPATPTLTVSGSALGAEGEVLTRQVRRFMAENPGLKVVLQSAPDDATQRHQLYVQWLNARVGTPDVLQLDVVWTAELAAAGWVLPLDRFSPDTADFFPAPLAANTWRGKLYALPWFVDVGMLYWRTDLLGSPPASLEELTALARRGMSTPGGPRYGMVWQGARYEGLVTVFLEILGGFGGRILGPGHRVEVDSPAGVAALTYLRDQITRSRVAPPEVLTWHEEETRFAFQNGNAVFLRNWPYAWTLMNQPGSRVAGRFAAAPMPAASDAPGGEPTAALGGAQLAINAFSRHPEAAFRLITYLTAPERMLERAEVAGQYPARRSVYIDPRLGPRLGKALGVPPAQVLRIVERARARPATPIYSEISEILQIHLHRALAGQIEPAPALAAAAREMEAVIERSGLGGNP